MKLTMCYLKINHSLISLYVSGLKPGNQLRLFPIALTVTTALCFLLGSIQLLNCLSILEEALAHGIYCIVIVLEGYDKIFFWHIDKNFKVIVFCF